MTERPLSAWVARGNVASARVVEKCGFRYVHGDGIYRVFVLD